MKQKKDRSHIEEQYEETVNEVKEPVEAVTNKGKEEICADFLSVAGTVIAAGVYTVALQFINMHLF